MFADDLRTAAEGLYGKPLRVLLWLAFSILPPFGGSDGKLRDGRSLLAVLHLRITAKIANQQNLLHGVKPPYRECEIDCESGEARSLTTKQWQVGPQCWSG